MSEETQLRDYVATMSLQPGQGLVKAKLELAKVTGGLTDELNLEQLGLTDEELQTIVGPISNLGHNLRVLNLFFNEITTIPVEFGKLVNLEEFKVGCNPLTSIPEGLFASMKTLKYLDIGYGNSLTEIPDSIGECSDLKELWVGNNRLLKLPDTLWKCTELEILQVYGNDMKELSSDIKSLKKLRVLNVGRNQITKLPESLGECGTLTELQVYENDLSSMPKSVASLPGLKVGNCYGNRKMGLPPREEIRRGLQATLNYYASLAN